MGEREIGMVERVAAAMAAFNNADTTDEPWHPEGCEDLARVAIEAMREPTQAMLDANLGLSPHHLPPEMYESRRDLRPRIYAAMINTALSETPITPAKEP